MITDEIIIEKICGPTKKNIQQKRLYNLEDIYKNYIINRYNDTNDLKENAIRIVKHINIIPCCPYCGNKYKLHSYKPKYVEECSQCANIKREQTMLNKYGYKNSFDNPDILKKAHLLSQTPEIIEKKKQTCLERYGVEHYTNREKSKETYNNKSDAEKQEIVNKAKQTKKERYGDENYNNVEKTKQTCLVRYGIDSYSKTNEYKEKTKQTCLERYGVEYVAQLDIFKKKSRQTCLERYGVEYGWNNDTQKQTCLERYGVDNVFKSDIIKDKIKQTCLERYGKTSYSKTDEFKKQMQKKHDEIIEKVNLTKKQNNTFKISQPEEQCYNILKEHYPDIIRQYSDKRYPFNCDFYIPSKDLFIEYNGSQFHKGHPFNENDENDIKILKELKEKANNSNRRKEGKKSQYDVMIYTWTDLDIRKRNIAKENNLNYIELWNLNDINKIIL